MTSAGHATLPHYRKIAAAGSSLPALVMVHGSSQHSGVFSAQVDRFRGRHPLLLIDLPGHGGSRDMPGPYGQAEYARSVLAALDAADVEAAHYWGTHTGAAVGLLLATQVPERFNSLTLEGAVLPGVEMPCVSAAIGRARAAFHARGIEAARQDWFSRSGFFDVIQSRPEPCRSEEHWAMIAEFEGKPWVDASVPQPVPPILDKLADIKTPTPLVNGEHDLKDFMEVADTLERRLPVVERAVIAGAGGFPLWEDPIAVNARVEAFIARHP